jgi:immunity protein 5 of polymorphic toxin system
MPKRLALKFLDEGGIGPYSGFSWPLPNGKPGRWVKATGPLAACESGIHACTVDQSYRWLRAECYVIELGGRVIENDDKLVARKGRLLYRVRGWNDKNARLFAADCAEHVLHLFEKQRPKDQRPRKAIEAARAYAKDPSEANKRAGAAARAAARAAAWDAAGAAAGDAAGAAAWDAAGDAARAAAGAAARAAVGAAARAAARAAAGAAAWAAAGAAARAAAGAAAGAAAWAAAGDALQPTLAQLQTSALDLIDQMLAVEA